MWPQAEWTDSLDAELLALAAEVLGESAVRGLTVVLACPEMRRRREHLRVWLESTFDNRKGRLAAAVGG